MTHDEVPLERRQRDYDEAVAHAEAVSARYLEARASGWKTWAAYKAWDAMDEAQLLLRRAKRRLEDTQRRLSRRS